MPDPPRFPAPGAELDRLRARCAALEAELARTRDEATAVIRDLVADLDRQRRTLEDAAAIDAALAAIRASNSGRLLAAADRWRARLADWRTRRRAARARRWRPGRAPAGRAPGVNVAGYINAESGMGEATRCSIRALRQAGLPVALNDVPGPQRTADRIFTDLTDANPHPFNLIHLNADNMEWFAAARGRDYFRDRYAIGYWFWELETFRDDWRPAFDYVDEVWVASEHTRRAVAERATVPVLHVPLGLPPAEAGRFDRAHFGIPEGPFAFLYMFDVSSQMERKNPLGAIRAFRLAGLGRDEAVLVLKFTNGDFDRDAVRRLADAAGGAHVLLLDGPLLRTEINALMRVTDCCVSLHRAEGLGLTIAEQMAMGKPAIATAYSGNLDFMTPEVSRLIPARRVPVARDYGPYLRGALWADPDLEAAADAMRDLARAPDRARTLGAAGQAHVRRVLDPARTAALMRARLEQIATGERTVSGVAPAPGADPRYA